MIDGKKPFLTLASVKKEMNAKNKETKAAEEAKVKTPKKNSKS